MLETSPALTFDNPHLSQPTNADLEAKNDLHQRVQTYVQEAFAPNTRRAYRADLVHFMAWGGSVPSNAEQVTAYLVAHAASHAMASLARRLVSIGKAHTTLGLPNPVATDMVRSTFRGIRRIHGQPQRQVKALVVQDLLAVLDRMGRSPRDLRDRALLLMGFAGALRRSELVGLDVADVEHVHHGILLTLRRSKTDQEGGGQKLGIPYARGFHCPIQALRDWLEVGGVSDGAIFRSISRHGRVSKGRLSHQAVSQVIKERVTVLGYLPTDFSGHSLRAGLATSAAHAGLPSWKIRNQTRHASEAMLSRYIRDGEIFRGNVVASLL